jgi:PPOX class probable F420-dependent enzyme
VLISWVGLPLRYDACMRTNLTVADLGDLLELPIVAVLATYRKDGSVLLSPVWHEWRDGGFNVWTNHDDIKTRHLARNPRASLVVNDDTWPYRGVQVEGEAVVSSEGFTDVLRRTARRYFGPEMGDAFAASVQTVGHVVRLEPTRIRAWDYLDEVAPEEP